MNMLAGAGAVPFAPAWKGVATEPGSESSLTLTRRCSRRVSVKYLACVECQTETEGRRHTHLLAPLLARLARFARDARAAHARERDVRELVVAVGHEQPHAERRAVLDLLHERVELPAFPLRDEPLRVGRHHIVYGMGLQYR